MADTIAEIARLEQIQVIEKDMYRASLSLKGIGIAGNYTDEAFGRVVETFNQAQVTMDNMVKAQRRLTMEQNATSLAMMKIQYAAMGRRRGMTRAEEAEMKRLEQEQMANRIAQMEGTIEMENFRMNHYDIAKDQYDTYIANYQHQIVVLRDAQNKELIDLNNHLFNLQTTYDVYADDLSLTQGKIVRETAEHYQTLIRLRAAYETAGTAVPDIITETIEKYAPPSPPTEFVEPRALPSLTLGPVYEYYTRQRGGSIYQTGLYWLHRGEHVTPAGGGTTAPVITVNPGAVQITIQGGDTSKLDTIQLANVLRKAMAQGLVDATGITKAKLR
jgi:nitrate reductase alpha subunit